MNAVRSGCMNKYLRGLLLLVLKLQLRNSSGKPFFYVRNCFFQWFYLALNHIVISFLHFWVAFFVCLSNDFHFISVAFIYQKCEIGWSFIKEFLRKSLYLVDNCFIRHFLDLHRKLDHIFSNFSPVFLKKWRKAAYNRFFDQAKKLFHYLNLNPTPILGLKLNMKSWVPPELKSEIAPDHRNDKVKCEVFEKYPEIYARFGDRISGIKGNIIELDNRIG